MTSPGSIPAPPNSGISRVCTHFRVGKGEPGHHRPILCYKRPIINTSTDYNLGVLNSYAVWVLNQKIKVCSIVCVDLRCRELSFLDWNCQRLSLRNLQWR